MAYSTARSLATGNAPGIPEQTGQTAIFGSASTESTTAQPQNIFDSVASSTWTSSPITGSYFIRLFSLGDFAVFYHPL